MGDESDFEVGGKIIAAYSSLGEAIAPFFLDGFEVADVEERPRGKDEQGRMTTRVEPSHEKNKNNTRNNDGKLPRMVPSIPVSTAPASMTWPPIIRFRTDRTDPYDP